MEKIFSYWTLLHRWVTPWTWFDSTVSSVVWTCFVSWALDKKHLPNECHVIDYFINNVPVTLDNSQTSLWTFIKQTISQKHRPQQWKLLTLGPVNDTEKPMTFLINCKTLKFKIQNFKLWMNKIWTIDNIYRIQYLCWRVNIFVPVIQEKRLFTLTTRQFSVKIMGTSISLKHCHNESWTVRIIWGDWEGLSEISAVTAANCSAYRTCDVHAVTSPPQSPWQYTCVLLFSIEWCHSVI